jgi:hypothetical protein
VAHLRKEHEVSQRRACSVLGADRSSVRYRSVRPDDAELRKAMKGVAAERRRFGYRRVHVMLERQGWQVNQKKLRRLYREEKLQVRKRGGRKRALGTRRPMLVPERANERWSLDFVSDAFTDGRRFRVLAIVDDCSRECLALIADTSLSGLRVTRELTAISLLWNYASKELNSPLGTNPAAGLAKYKPAREYEPWPDWMVSKLVEAPEMVRTAATLILGAGQRPSAAIGMRYSRFSGEWMEVCDEKGNDTFEGYCPQMLREYVDGLHPRGRHLLAKNLTEPLGYDAVERQFRKWRASLGDRAALYSMHGLRKLAIIHLAEVGCGDAEIQAVTGQSVQMVAYYRASANLKRLSTSAQERRS